MTSPINIGTKSAVSDTSCRQRIFADADKRIAHAAGAGGNDRARGCFDRVHAERENQTENQRRALDSNR